MNIFSPNSRFMRAVSVAVDAIWINVLLAVTCVPIVTAGAALVSAHDAARRRQKNEGHVTRDFFRAFRSNFGQATLIWLVFLVPGAAIAWLWFFDPHNLPLLVTKIGLTAVWIIGFEWAWYLQSRFSNPVHRTLALSWIFGLTHFGTTALLILIDSAYVAAVAWSVLRFQKALFLLVLCGYGACIFAHVPILERSMRYQLSASAQEQVRARERHEPAGRGDGTNAERVPNAEAGNRASGPGDLPDAGARARH